MISGKLVKTLVCPFILLLMAGCHPLQASTPTPTQASTPTPTQAVPSPTGTAAQEPYGDEASFSLNETYDGLTLTTGGDVDIETVLLPDTEEKAFRSGNGAALHAVDGNDTPDNYIQFQVDDDFLHGGSPTSRVVFVIDYLDEGFDSFNVQYDSLSVPFKDTGSVYKTGSGELRTVHIAVCDANFANRDNGADFRIADTSDGAETILRVAVRKGAVGQGPRTINVDSCGANPFDDQPDSDAIQTCISQACSGDTILFTSGLGAPGYQGYLIDKTIFLVYPNPKSDLTFSSTDARDHALLKATADLKGFVVHLLPRSVVSSHGLIDNVTLQHLNLDGNRAERVCTGDPLQGQAMALGEGENDNWGSWLPECSTDEPSDPWCNPGTLYLGGAVDFNDPMQDYAAHPDSWSTGMVVQDVILSNTECGTAFFFSGADYRIDSVTVDTAGEHVHVPGCAMTETDDPIGDWSDGITYMGPAHQLTNNLIMDASDVGMVSFGGRDVLIQNNTIKARPGNHGMFAGIAMHPGQFGLISGLQVIDNQIINEADPTCGGIHIGINLGVHTWGNGCAEHPVPATYGISGDCSIFSPPPAGELCGTDTFCRTWGYIPVGGTLTLADNTVTGAQVSYVISGLDVLGKLILSGNQSIDPHLTDWEGDVNCVWTEGYADSWGALDFVAFNPSIDGWTEQSIYCVR